MTRARSVFDLPPHLRAQAQAKLAGQARVVRPLGPRDVGNKFNSQPVIVRGRKFASKKEYRCYRDLELRQHGGEISGLRFQVKFSLFAAGGECPGEHIGTYTADFVFKENGRLVVADAKSEATRRKETWPRTKKLMRMCHSIEVVEL